MYRRRETSKTVSSQNSILNYKSTEKINNDDNVNIAETAVLRPSTGIKQKDHGISDSSLLHMLDKMSLLPKEYIEKRQGHLLVNLSKGVASLDYENDRLCFVEFLHFVCRVHLERLHIKEGGTQIAESVGSIHEHILSDHAKDAQLLKHHTKQLDLLNELPSFIVYGSHIVDGAYHNVIKPKHFAKTLKETIDKFAQT